MQFLLLVIICILINVISKYIFKLIEEYRQIKKAKDIAKNVDFNKILNGLDKDFYNDINKDDIDLDK